MIITTQAAKVQRLETARAIHRAIDLNTKLFYLGTRTYEDRASINRTLWDRARDEGVEMAVLDLILAADRERHAGKVGGE